MSRGKELATEEAAAVRTILAVLTSFTRKGGLPMALGTVATGLTGYLLNDTGPRVMEIGIGLLAAWIGFQIEEWISRRRRAGFPDRPGPALPPDPTDGDRVTGRRLPGA